MTEQELIWRDEVRPGDPGVVRRLCESSGFFSAAEIDMAVELVEERILKGTASGYHFLFAQYGETAYGYACYGPIPGTDASWDLYWIAVQEEKRGHGLGRKVQVEVERRTVLFGGRRIYIWTSSREQYQPTRRFYERMGYTAEARLKDYYKPGEHLIIYAKVLN